MADQFESMCLYFYLVLKHEKEYGRRNIRYKIMGKCFPVTISCESSLHVHNRINITAEVIAGSTSRAGNQKNGWNVRIDYDYLSVINMTIL